MYAMMRAEMSSIEPEKLPGIPGGPGGPGGPGFPVCLYLPAQNKKKTRSFSPLSLRWFDLVTLLQKNSYLDIL